MEGLAEMAGTGVWCTASWKPMKVFGLWFGSRYPIDNHDHAAEKGSAPDQLHNATTFCCGLLVLCTMQGPKRSQLTSTSPSLAYRLTRLYTLHLFLLFVLHTFHQLSFVGGRSHKWSERACSWRRSGFFQSWDDCVGWRAGWGRKTIRALVI